MALLKDSENTIPFIGLSLAQQDSLLLVIKLTSGSPASKSNLKIGSQILEINGQKITQIEHF